MSVGKNTVRGLNSRLSAIALMIGCIFVMLCAIYYKLAPNEVVVPNIKVATTKSMFMALEHQNILLLAGVFGLIGDFAIGIGTFNIAMKCLQKQNYMASLGWLTLFFDVIIFAYSNYHVGFLFKNLSLANNQLAFALAMHNYSNAFIFGTIFFGLGAALSMVSEIKTGLLGLGRTFAIICFFAAIFTFVVGVFGFMGLAINLASVIMVSTLNFMYIVVGLILLINPQVRKPPKIDFTAERDSILG